MYGQDTRVTLDPFGAGFGLTLGMASERRTETRKCKEKHTPRGVIRVPWCGQLLVLSGTDAECFGL